MRIAFAVALSFAVPFIGSCRSQPSSGADAEAPPRAAQVKEEEKPVASLDLVERLSRCEIDHEGVLIDLGSPAVQGATGFWALAPDPSLVDSEREGETWTKVLGRTLSLRFVLEEPGPVFVSMRARGGASRGVALALDGKPLGVVPLVRGQP